MTKSILIVEDDKNIQMGLSKSLRKKGFLVYQAFDGEEGVYFAKNNNPDLIILDLMMPFRNGFEVIADLRHDGDQTPILILSAKTRDEDKVRGFKLGADDFVSKPFAIEELLARINRKLDYYHDHI